MLTKVAPTQYLGMQCHQPVILHLPSFLLETETKKKHLAVSEGKKNKISAAHE